MSLSEYAVMFVLVAIMGAGIPGPGDASLIAAGALAGEGKLAVHAGSGGRRIFWIGSYVGISYLLGEEIAKLVGKIGTKALIGVIMLVVVGLLIRAGLSKWRANRQARLA